MEQSNKFYKNNPSDVIWWVENSDTVGEWLFSFDNETILNLFADYPDKLTSEQKEIFDKENPFWGVHLGIIENNDNS